MSESMFVLAVISQKGGSGKTTLTVNFAVAAAEHGFAAVVIDMDPQANAANWKDRRNRENPAVVSAPPSRLRQTLQAAADHGADFVVIDNPGKQDSGAIAAASVADLVYVPAEANMFHLETLPGVHTLLQAAENTPPALLILNKFHSSATTQADKTKTMIGDVYPFTVCPHHLSQLDAYATSANKRAFCPRGRARWQTCLRIRQIYKFTCAQSNKLGGGLEQTGQSAKRA